MKDPTESARDDLAFVRALVSEGGQAQKSLGEALLAGGLCYGGQCLLQTIPAAGVDLPLAYHLTVGITPTLLFLAAIVWISIRDKNKSPHGVGTRAISAAFGASGLAALTTAAIFGYLSARSQRMETWLLHPMMICVVQGTVWYIAFSIRRRGWLGLVSIGWFVTALVLALLLGTGDPRAMPAFVGLLALALLGLMALPGWVLLRSARADA